MNEQATVEITDREGWRKVFPLSKSLVHIGSDPRSDVVLETWRGGGVSARHLQLIAAPGQALSYRAVNLGESDVRLEGSGGRLLKPRSAAEIGDGERVRLGDFLLVFRLSGAVVAAAPRPAPAPKAVAAATSAATARPSVEEASSVIGLNLFLPETALSPERPLDGSVSVQNLGDRPGVQFKLELEGLDADCHEIGPGPILFPGVAKDVRLRLHHSRRPQPAAGPHQIRVRATSDEYPGEVVSVLQEIQILPFYNHELSLVVED